jgi:hypothetical protein
MRTVLYLYVLLVACPIRYWPLQSGIDPTWRFALNYAHAAEIQAVFTSGPLAYLVFPQHFGRNLSQALLFQAVLWLVLAAIFADLFFRGGFPVRNIALFSFCFGLAAPFFWFNSFGLENLILTGALLLIMMFHFRGSWTRYLAALVLVGLLPLFKLTAGLIGLGALAGFLVERALRLGRSAILTATVTAVVPVAVATAAYLWLMPSVRAILSYLRGSIEIMAGFTAAMSLPGRALEFIWAFAAIAVLAILLCLQAHHIPNNARFYGLLLVIPLVISLKHGFVRQDSHVIDFFCFAALCLAMVSLTTGLHGKNASRVVFLVMLFFIMWLDTVGRWGVLSAVEQATGVRTIRILWGALPFDRLEQRLDSSIAAFPEHFRIEPQLLSMIGDSPVASLSMNYTNVAAARTRFTLYPVIQRYAAYTPYLDGLNAAWIRDKGPRFLVFDGQSIDGRDPWAETPAMWMEVYRWYDTRLLAPRNLLLERRAEPRFTSLETISRFRLNFPGELRLPPSREDVFWTINCGYSTRGQVQKLFFRNPEVLISVREKGGATRSARVIPEVLVTPVLGNYLPGNLAQFAALFGTGVDRGYYVSQILFEDSGSAAYASTCEAEVLRPVR